jgi:diketogulonate reductase-like aldo/keto reductase
VPWQRQQRLPLMAYCPIDQGALALEPELKPLAQRLGATPAQPALTWLLLHSDVAALPKAVRESQLRENAAAADLRLDADTLAALDRLFPPPEDKQELVIT